MFCQSTAVFITKSIDTFPSPWIKHIQSVEQLYRPVQEWRTRQQQDMACTLGDLFGCPRSHTFVVFNGCELIEDDAIVMAHQLSIAPGHNSIGHDVILAARYWLPGSNDYFAPRIPSFTLILPFVDYRCRADDQNMTNKRVMLDPSQSRDRFSGAHFVAQNTSAPRRVDKADGLFLEWIQPISGD